VWRQLTEFRLLEGAKMSFKANLLPRHTAAFVAGAAKQGWLIQAHAGNGIVIGHRSDDLTVEQAGTMLKELLGQAVAAGGNLIVLRCPPEWKTKLPIWGQPRGDRELMRAVKQKIDPKNLFNPGRFVVG
jgi:glycolate oxidase FAD binding subunit